MSKVTISRETVLRQYLNTVKNHYTHILIDCQPSLGMLTVNALTAANHLLIHSVTRTVREYQRGHIEGFYNIPVDELRDRLDEVDPTKPVYVICQSGLRSYISCRILEGNGYTAYNFAGGFRFYCKSTKYIKMYLIVRIFFKICSTGKPQFYIS